MSAASLDRVILHPLLLLRDQTHTSVSGTTTTMKRVIGTLLFFCLFALTNSCAAAPQDITCRPQTSGASERAVVDVFGRERFLNRRGRAKESTLF